MSRGLSVDFVTHLNGPELYPAYFVEMQFREQTFRLWTGPQDIVWNAQTWVAIGAVGRISNVDESQTTAANGIDLELVGQGSGIYQAAAGDAKNIKGRPLKVFIAFMWPEFDEVRHIYELGKWKMDVMEVSDVMEQTSGGIRIALTAESEMVEFFRGSPAYYSDTDQQRLYSGDRFFRFIAALPGKTLPWGVKSRSITGTNGGWMDLVRARLP